MKHEFERCKLVLSAVPILKKKVTLEGEDLLLNVIQAETKALLRKNGEDEQLILLARLIAINAEMKFLEPYIK